MSWQAFLIGLAMLGVCGGVAYAWPTAAGPALLVGGLVILSMLFQFACQVRGWD